MKQGWGSGPRNPEKRTCFPRARFDEDESNQEQEKAAAFAGACCDVEFGQRQCLRIRLEVARYRGSLRRMATDVRVGLCQSWKLKWRSRPHRGQRWRLA